VPFERWVEPEPLPDGASILHPDPLLSEILYRRGIRTAEDVETFLRPSLGQAADPFRLPNMEAAARRVCEAIERGERIGVFGDYDADGVTSTALLVVALRAATGDPAQVRYRLPTRSEGYGLNETGIGELAAGGATLLIAADCGSCDHPEVEHARRLGMDIVVLDHHQMDDDGPPGAIVVSARLPSAPPDAYPELSAVGLAYLLVKALVAQGCVSTDRLAEQELLDLVALGTIGDVSPMTGANRGLVATGLRRIHDRPRPGIAALCRRARIEPPAVTSGTIAFKLVPRLNSAGRIGDPRIALELLLTEDHRQADALSRDLEVLNEERKARGQEILFEAERMILERRDLDSRGLFIVAGDGWSGGVLGLAAAKLTERFGRPVIVLSRDGEISRGSARSIPGFDINAALAQSAPLVREHGGHSQAAGLAMFSKDIDALETSLSEAVRSSAITLPRANELHPDAVLPVEHLRLDTARRLQVLEPHGAGNEAPLLLVRGARVRQYALVGLDKTHLKLFVETGRGTAQVMVWGAASRSAELLHQRPVDLALTLRVDRWNGEERLEAVATDFRVTG
jgi:single-stranded-DNA-specific exonuclease